MKYRKLVGSALMLTLLFYTTVYSSASSLESCESKSVHSDIGSDIGNVKGVDSFYVNQLDSKYYSDASCVASVGKMACNILLPEDESSCATLKLDAISKGIRTDERGALLTSLKSYLDSKTDLDTDIFYTTSVEDVKDLYKNILDSGAVIGVSVKTTYLNDKYKIDVPDGCIHALLIYDYVITEGVIKYLVKDPYNNNLTLYVTAEDIFESISMSHTLSINRNIVDILNG